MELDLQYAYIILTKIPNSLIGLNDPMTSSPASVHLTDPFVSDHPPHHHPAPIPYNLQSILAFLQSPKYLEVMLDLRILAYLIPNPGIYFTQTFPWLILITQIYNQIAFLQGVLP